jgi:hypothetical protein
MKSTVFWNVTPCRRVSTSKVEKETKRVTSENKEQADVASCCLMVTCLVYTSTLKVNVSAFLRKINKFLPDYTALHPR